LTFATPLLIAAALLLILAAALQAFTTNRYVKKKLQFSLFLTGLSLSLGLVQLHPDIAETLQDFKRVPDLLFVLALINTGVIVAINPLRADRISDRFPNIVQDSLIVGMFFMIATVVFKETILTASAVSAVVVGFALQDTLGNAFAGLGIQVEKPFRVGNWIKVGDFEGKVSQVTWRATKLLTRAGTYIVVPNNIISKESIVNYSEPILPVRLWVDVGVTYNKPPNAVKAALLEAIDQAPLALKTPVPDVLLMDFAASAINYRARFWIADFEVDDIAYDQVRTAIFYALARRGIEIPYPIQIEMSREETSSAILTRNDMESLLGDVQIFASLSEDERKQLAARCREAIYATGEIVVRQGEAGASMFVVCSGQVKVTIEPGTREVARTDPGGFFGEMSLLTGDPRTATVSATCDSVLLEIPADGFRQIALAQPAVVEAVGLAVVARRAGLDQARAEAALLDASLREQSRSLISRVRRFLRLPGA
jgi:small-conductance mechanosensitive channel/CRP-like cAMP-binding protein